MQIVKFFIQKSWLLLIAAFCFGVLLAVTNAVLSPMIEKNRIEALNQKMRHLISDANTFEPAVEGVVIADAKTTIYKGLNDANEPVGFAFVGIGSGFADKIQLVIAMDAKCQKLKGFQVLMSNETPGFGDKIKEKWFQGQFNDAPADKLQLSKSGNIEEKDDTIVSITGATISSDAVVSVFNTYIKEVKNILKKEGIIQ